MAALNVWEDIPMKVRMWTPAVLLACSWQAVLAQIPFWQKQPGSALDISGNAAGSLWIVGTDRTSSAGFYAYKWNGTEFVRQDWVSPSRTLAINSFDQLYLMDDFNSLLFQGKSAGAPIVYNKGRDIVVGADNSVWRVGLDKRPGGYGLYKQTGFPHLG